MEICIVDDSYTMRLITSRVCKLTMPNIPVLDFASVDEAIAYFTTHESKQRILFVDLEMPGKNGWDFLNSYHPHPDDQVYILSSASKEDHIGRAKTYPFVSDFLMKPLTMNVLRSIAPELI